MKDSGQVKEAKVIVGWDGNVVVGWEVDDDGRLW